MQTTGRALIRGAVAGALAGLVASYAMNAFQEAVSRANPEESGGSDEDPSTVKAAEWLAGRALPKDRKEAAGNQVHYALGAMLGLLYGVACAATATASAGFGMPFGAAVFLIGDEAVVPALGLSGPPWRSPASTHAYSLASHLVFGAVLEGVRRMLAGRK